MKKTILFTLIVLLISISCSKNDDNGTPAAENKAPEAFNLIGVTNGAVRVDVLPTFSWQAANDQEGDAITYDLYLGKEENPTTLYAENLSAASFTLTDRLNLYETYYWKVVAKDPKQATRNSEVYSFSSRGLNLPSSPVTVSASFSARTSHTTVVFDNKLWVIGGVSNVGGTSDIRKNDVWAFD